MYTNTINKLYKMSQFARKGVGVGMLHVQIKPNSSEQVPVGICQKSLILLATN